MPDERLGEEAPALFHPTRGDRSAPVKRERARELRQTMTPTERILWERLRAYRSRGFPFRRQQVVAGLIADFYCHPARLIVEVDGPIHRSQQTADAERDQIFAGLGLRTLRLTNDDVRQRLPEALTRIEAALR